MKTNIYYLKGIEAHLLTLTAEPAALFVAPDIPEPYFREILVRVKNACEAHGVQLPPTCWRLQYPVARQDFVAYDLAFALTALAAAGKLPDESVQRLAKCLVLGELALTGDTRSVRGVLSAALTARSAGLEVLAPEDSLSEALVAGSAMGASTLTHAVSLLETGTVLPPVPYGGGDVDLPYDMADVVGQSAAKAAIEVAAAGGHHIFLEGPPGSGKTMLSRRALSLLPPMEEAEALELTKVCSAAGLLHGGGWMRRRPFRAPHHTISEVGIYGGGSGTARPGEVSLATQGVLFLDLYDEFRRGPLELVRDAARTHEVRMSRMTEEIRYPSNIWVIGAGGPCPCGQHPSPRCQCTKEQRDAYTERRRDRGGVFQMHVALPAIRFEEARAQKEGPPPEKSADIRARVEAARAVQAQRYERAEVSYRTNAEIPPQDIARWVDQSVFEEYARDKKFRSASNYNEVSLHLQRVARTLADLAGDEQVAVVHLLTATTYTNRLFQKGGRSE